MRYLYGDFPDQQIADVKKSIRGSIYFLLLCVDPETSGKYQEININKTFENLLYRLDGFNSLLFYPKEIVNVMCLLQAAQNIYNKPDFSFKTYRKLILDAGAQVLKIGGE